MKNVYQIIDHGVMNSQYFQGCGVCGTIYEDVATGIGSSACDACEDALESLALSGWEVDEVLNDLSNSITVPEDSEDCYHYVSVRIAKDTDRDND